MYIYTYCIMYTLCVGLCPIHPHHETILALHGLAGDLTVCVEMAFSLVNYDLMWV